MEVSPIDVCYFEIAGKLDIYDITLYRNALVSLLEDQKCQLICLSGHRQAIFNGDDWPIFAEVVCAFATSNGVEIDVFRRYKTATAVLYAK